MINELLYNRKKVLVLNGENYYVISHMNYSDAVLTIEVNRSDIKDINNFLYSKIVTVDLLSNYFHKKYYVGVVSINVDDKYITICLDINYEHNINLEKSSYFATYNRYNTIRNILE